MNKTKVDFIADLLSNKAIKPVHKEKLFSLANDDLKMAADGGGSVDDIFEEIEGKDWAKFVKVFLRT